ncbi:MAG: LLM class flavin-dependent oxidoreductase [Ilumatobacteraceae bacterium]
MRTGVWLYPVAPADELLEAVVRLDAAGIDEVWIADEGVARDPLVILAAAARETKRITLAVGITSPLLRHPGAVMSTAMTIDELSDGRVILGWGVGGHESLGPFGLSSSRPVGVVRDALVVGRAVMTGTSIPDYSPPSHAAPPRPIRQFVGARGPQLNRLASRLADGVFLSGLTAAEIPRVVADARSHRPIEVALYQSVFFEGRADHRSLQGSPSDVAQVLRALVRDHRPTSIGLALVDREPLRNLVPRACEVLIPLAEESAQH